jgi:hypothetical protein
MWEHGPYFRVQTETETNCDLFHSPNKRNRGIGVQTHLRKALPICYTAFLECDASAQGPCAQIYQQVTDQLTTHVI